PPDARQIRRLIYSERLNPLGLDWRRFWLAVDESGKMIGCGQVKPHWDGSRELASIAVVRNWRGRGVASAIIRQLLAENPPPLYLTCRAELTGFYARFGFQEAGNPAELPPYFRQVARLSRWLRCLSRQRMDIRVLRLT
ncbi:MAG: GNAT family N-acetyltransferase, partial [Chloroflexota bacterium]